MKFIEDLKGVIKDKWHLFGEEQSDPDWLIEQQERLLHARERLEAEQAAVLALVRMPGWKLFMDYSKAKVEVNRSKLEPAVLKGDKEKALALASEIKAFRSFESFVHSKLGDIG